MKILISYPPLSGPGSPMLTQNRQFQWFSRPSFIYPLVASQAATLLKKNGFDVIWNDCIAERWTYARFIEFVKEEKPDLIAFESKTPVIKQHWRIIDEIRLQITNYELRITPIVVLMGDHVTALPEESMRNCKVDYVLTGGDYDQLLLNLASHLRDKKPLEKGVWYREDSVIKNTGDFALTQDLNDLPFIDRRLTKAHMYGEKWMKRRPSFYTMAGRDCHWGRCTFCSWCNMYPKFRARTPANLLDEIGTLISEHGAKEIFDDTGTFPVGAWLEEFCRGMIERGFNRKILFSCNMRFGHIDQALAGLMKRSGFRKVKMGLESANQDTLDRLNKNIKAADVPNECAVLKRAGIDVHLTVMIGYPWEDKDAVERTFKLSKLLMEKGYIEMLQSTVVIPYPGSELYKQAAENGWFRFPPEAYERYDMREEVLNTPIDEPGYIADMCRKIYSTFTSPRYIMRHLSRIRSVSDMGYILRGSKAAFGHIKDFGIGR